MAISLFEYQDKAVKDMKNGCILCGGVGSGKSRTSLAYYYICQGGKFELKNTEYSELMKCKVFNYDTAPMQHPKDLFIITTAKKRDSLDWEGEMIPFGIKSASIQIHVDSWNNIKKYKTVTNAFFIFDEQRVVGYGTWTKSFLKIAQNNDWILLSATPGDKWEDYIPVFVANGFFKNKTEFVNNHMQVDYSGSYPRVIRYFNTGRLLRLRNNILVDMDFYRPTISHHEDVYCNYNSVEYKQLIKTRWNSRKDEPIENGSQLCYEMRRVVNSDPSRLNEVVRLQQEKERIIIFYNFDYELELLLDAFNYLPCGQLNGHTHEPVPDGEEWVYLVQYTAGAEAWNCIKTNTIVFFSQNYSYKILAQSCGRIDRLNTPYRELYYYHLKSRSGIDVAINKALKEKKNFNESRFIHH